MPVIIFPALLIFLVIFSCLFYGSVTLLSATIIESMVSLMMLMWLIDMGRKGRLSFLKTGLFLPLALFLAVVLFQIVPLPIAALRIISGRAAYLYHNFIPSGFYVCSGISCVNH